ncbi:oxidoreductase [Pectobacterium polonicum]|uniref:oxidoreductase n=1 Tax=Pectobacterium polonicum TaxID=2485124 RepID=UPI00375459CE
MNNILADKSILIAGAGGLLGSKLIPAILAQGGTILAADMNLDQMISRLKQNGVDTNDVKIRFFQLDITDVDSVKKLFDENPNLDGAVNTTYPRNKSYGKHFFDVTLDSFNENVSLHLGSAFSFSQQCAVYFKRHERAFSLVNISSIYGVMAPKFEIYANTPMTMPVEYAAIKSAIIHLNKYIVKYIDDSKFRINSVSPGGIFDNQPSEFLVEYKKNTHGAGMLKVDEVIGAILFLLSEQSKYVTGQNIIVDDGFSL